MRRAVPLAPLLLAAAALALARCASAPAPGGAADRLEALFEDLHARGLFDARWGARAPAAARE
jgi:hypothetical protein